MKHLSLILVIFIGLSARSLAGNPIDSLEQTNANLTVEKKIELYRKHLTLQNAEENTFYHGLINQLNNSFQAKAIQTHHTKTSILIYSILIITLCIFCLLLIYIIRQFLQLYHKEKQNREQTQILLDNTEDINTTKARFLQEISYKIRTPLNSVMGLSDILANNPELIEPEDIKKISETIQSNSQELQQLVNAVLDLSRLESGMMKYNLSDYSLKQICQDAISIVRMHSEHPIGEIAFDDQIGDAKDTINTDVTRLTQLLSEMLYLPKKEEKKGTDEKVTLTLDFCKENTSSLFVKITNSPMALYAEEESLNSIRQKIAQLLIEHFGGTFCIQSADITFTYPLK